MRNVHYKQKPGQMSYYFLIRLPRGRELRDIRMRKQENGLSRKVFSRGTPVKETVNEPIVIEVTSEEDYIMPEFFPIPLVLRDDLLEAVLEFGVDNIDAYDCILKDLRTGETWENYKICNLIGLVDVFDMEASELHEDSPTKAAFLFDEIVIDKKMAEGFHFFRPYGRMSQFIVSEDLKKHIESKNKFQHLEFVKPEDFA